MKTNSAVIHLSLVHVLTLNRLSDTELRDISYGNIFSQVVIYLGHTC